MFCKRYCSFKDEPLLNVVFLFFMKTSSDFLSVVNQQSAVGPQLVTFQENFAVATQTCPALLPQLSMCSQSEGVLCLLAAYYLMDLTYPSSFGQFLGLLQEIVLGHPFVQKTKKLTKLLLECS
jgi:hypothetical protein